LLHMSTRRRLELEAHARKLEIAAKQLRSTARGIYADRVF
jgi:hypothetical protein